MQREENQVICKEEKEREGSCVAVVHYSDSVIRKSGSPKSRPVRSVPYPEEAVPRTGGHSHAITGHPQTADPVVMPS